MLLNAYTLIGLLANYYIILFDVRALLACTKRWDARSAYWVFDAPEAH